MGSRQECYALDGSNGEIKLRRSIERRIGIKSEQNKLSFPRNGEPAFSMAEEEDIAVGVIGEDNQTRRCVSRREEECVSLFTKKEVRTEVSNT